MNSWLKAVDCMGQEGRPGQPADRSGADRSEKAKDDPIAPEAPVLRRPRRADLGIPMTIFAFPTSPSGSYGRWRCEGDRRRDPRVPHLLARGGEATVLEHVKAAIHCLLADKSCSVRCGFTADLNDALNIPKEEQAEMTRHWRADFAHRCGEAKGLSVGGKDIQGDLPRFPGRPYPPSK